MSEALLVVEDDASLAEALCDTLDLAGYSVLHASDGEAALALMDQNEIAMVISDVQMAPMDGHTLLKAVKQKRPELPFLLMTAYGTIQKAVEAMHDGAVDYLVKPFEAEVLVNQVARYLGNPGEQERDLVGEDPHTEALRELAKRVAESDATVMITGESGTGKEVLARYIHRHSPRAEQPFVAVNCAAIPENMLEATLFGYEKGAFTGAYQASPGKFEQAQGGTLLLDEISEMDLGLQAKLLRVLQEREVERLGGRKMIKLDVRVLATSNRNMPQEVSKGSFREDLFYRLNVFPLSITPLRERKLDIVPLTEYLLALHAKQSGRPIPSLSAAARDKLLGHNWPGNVRELDNVVQRALIMQRGDQIQDSDLIFETLTRPAAAAEAAVANSAAIVEFPSPGVNNPSPQEAGGSLGGNLKNQEFQMIFEALKTGNRKQVAERLGISERTLRYKLAQMRDAGWEIS